MKHKEPICTCQDCGEDIEVFNLGYLGAVDPEDTRCNTNMTLVALCKECVKGTVYSEEG